MNQDDKEFKWFILFDEDTPSEFISAICDDSPAHPILAKGQGQAIRRSVEHIDMGRRTLSLRLDSDDAIAFDFVKTARHKSTMIGASLFIEKFAISFLKGCEYSAQQDIYFERRYFGSPFVVICEMPRAPGRYIGPFPTSHIQVPNMYPYLSMPSEHPMWQITIHGDNVANTVKGKTKINDVKHLFGF